MATENLSFKVETSLINADDKFDEILQTLQRKIKLADGLYDLFVKRSSEERTLHRTKALLQQLDIIAQEQKILDRRIYQLASEEDLKHRFITGGSYLAAYNRYIDMRGNLTELIDMLTPEINIQNAITTSSNNSWFKLEKLKPPKFDGDFTKWNNFKELYVSLIHNERMPTVQKFHFLRSSLEGEAFELIENFQITETNYNTAWQMLQDRYEDECGLVWAHLKTLFSVKRMKNESHEEIRRLFDQTTRVCEALKNLGRRVSHWSDLLVYLTVNKMDVETRKHFELHASTITTFPAFDQIKNFLEERAKRMSRMPISATNSRSQGKWPAKAHHVTQDIKVVCPICTSNHLLMSYPSFKTLTIKDRREYVKTKKLCYNCFRGNHGVKDCETKGRCRTCKKKHHTMVCSFIAKSTPRKSEDNVAHIAVNPSDNESTEEEISGDEASSEENSAEDEATACQANQLTSRESSVLLATALVRLRTADGRYAIVRAIIDPGSELSFVSDSIARVLRAPKVKVNLCIAGVGGERTACCKSAISCAIEPCEKSEPSLPIIAQILPKLTSYTRPAQTTATSWKHLKGLKFADAGFDDKRKIDLIIGADLYSAIVLEGVRKGSINTPMAQETIFGWVVSGPQNSTSTNDGRTKTSVHHCVTREQIDTLLQRFWDLEDMIPCIRSTPQDENCEKLFLDTHICKKHGIYVVQFPLKNPLPLEIGNSYSSHSEVLENVPKKLLASRSISPINQNESLRVLGVRWDMKCDAFKFSVSLQNAKGFTKREILSAIARIFDSVDWLSSVRIVAKILIQELWLLRLDWYDETPDEMHDRWKKFHSQLFDLRQINIPSDYSLQAFLAAFDRFVSRRDRPSDMYSDNGTTFQTAERELPESIRRQQQNNNLQTAIATDGIHWHFIPSLKPHFVGLWEAGVKSVKNHLKCILNDTTPTFEEWTTLPYKIECNINSRLIRILPHDPGELCILTSGQFLMERPPNAVPTRSVLEVNPARLSRLQFVQQLNKIFWSQWRNEYLHTLQQRTNLSTTRENLRVNELILIKELLTAPNKWSLAWISGIHYSDDGNVGAVTVKTATQLLKLFASDYQTPWRAAISVSVNHDSCTCIVLTIIKNETGGMFKMVKVQLLR